MTNLLPLPNRNPTTSNGYNYVSDIINPQPRAQQLVRVDYNISNNTKLYTRLNHEGETEPFPYGMWVSNAWSDGVPYPSNIIGKNRSYSSSTSLTQVLNPATTNEVLFSATYLNLPHWYEDPSKISRKDLGYPYQGIYKNDVDRIPNFSGWGTGVAPFLQPGGFDPELYSKKWLISAGDNFKKVKSTHTLKFGAFFQLTTNSGPISNTDQGQFLFARGEATPQATRMPTCCWGGSMTTMSLPRIFWAASASVS